MDMYSSRTGSLVAFWKCNITTYRNECKVYERAKTCSEVVNCVGEEHRLSFTVVPASGNYTNTKAQLRHLTPPLLLALNLCIVDLTTK